MRELPDVSRLLSLDGARWAKLGERLRASGLDARYLARVLRVGERVDDAMRAPMRLWTLRRARDEAALGARLFVFGDVLARAEAESAVGDLSPWLDAGLITEREDGFACPFRLAFALDRLVFADDLAASGDAVMGPAATSVYACLAARPSARVGSLLDLGCGAGTIALALADRAERVVATDVSARALALAETNARLNGVANLELRRGDWLEPVRGERFDLVVSQPPFVARRAGEGDAPFLHGGRRGDEIALGLFARIGDAIGEGGRAIVLVDWPVVDADPIDARVRRAIPEVDLACLVLASPARSLEDHCTLHAAAAHPTLDDAFARAALAMRDHLEAEGVRSLRLAINVLERVEAPAWTALVSVGHFADAPPSAVAIDRVMRSRDLLARPEALADARLAIPADVRCDAPIAGQVVVRPARDRLLPPVVVDARVVECAERVARAGSPGAAGANLEQTREALAAGLLDVVSERASTPRPA
ncbi:MAG TPA: methyltransferase [Polyangiaceae bacterium]|jgi:SAM-dependent methyltransferase